MVASSLMIALVLVILTTLLIAFQVKKTLVSGHKSSQSSSYVKKVPTIIIAGPSYSGKTSLFHKLTSDETNAKLLTVMSQEPSFALKYKVTMTTLADYPGHVKLAYKLKNGIIDLKGNLKGILFVLDSTIDPKNITETAEYLTEILLILEKIREPIDILIACNKNESFTARQPLKIKEALENEITRIFERKKKSLGNIERDIGDVDEINENLDLSFDISKGFKFDYLEGNVEVLAGSVHKNKITTWQEWVGSHLV